MNKVEKVHGEGNWMLFFFLIYFKFLTIILEDFIFNRTFFLACTSNAITFKNMMMDMLVLSAID